MLSAMGKFNEEMAKAGVMLTGEGLQASSKGALVRQSGGKVTVIDGPFTEAKELVAGFWIIQTKSKAEAIQWIERAPFEDDAVVEIRELYELSDFPQDPSEKPDGWRAEEERMREASPPARKAGTTRYMVMLRGNKTTESGALPNEKVLSEMGTLMEAVMTSGVCLSGEGLKPTSRGARIRYSGTKRTVVDGPFTEAKELIAGYTMVQTATRAEAIDFAKRWLKIHVDGLGLDGGAIEVRQLFELEDFPVNPAEKPGGWRDQEARARA
jgi:hypothetical protein